VYSTTSGPKDIDTNYLSYPLSNAILVIPLSVIRWIENTGPNRITSTDGLVAVIIFGFSGVTNVFLLLYFRPNLLLFGRGTIHCKCCTRLLKPPVGSGETLHIDIEEQTTEGKPPFFPMVTIPSHDRPGSAQQAQDMQ